MEEIAKENLISVYKNTWEAKQSTSYEIGREIAVVEN